MVKDLLFWRVVLRKPWSECERLSNGKLHRGFSIEAPSVVSSEPMLDFLWQFADDSARQLVTSLANRSLYKRVFEARLGQLGTRADYSGMKGELALSQRVHKARALQRHLLDEVLNSMRERGPTESSSENAAKLRHSELVKSKVPLVVLDFPSRGIGQELNTPKELGDAARKYSVIPAGRTAPEDNVFHVVRQLQEQMATVRVFASPELHELIVRYLNPASIQSCVESVVPSLRTRQ
jgi:hypothetical protein